MNILIVDDNLALVRSLELVLTEHGHHVHCFSDPATASLYLEQSPEIDVLLLDYLMGEMKGDELLRNMRENLATRCNIIMITGHREEITSTKKLEALGVRRVLCKPLDLDELCELVES